MQQREAALSSDKKQYWPACNEIEGIYSQRLEGCSALRKPRMKPIGALGGNGKRSSSRQYLHPPGEAEARETGNVKSPN